MDETTEAGEDYCYQIMLLDDEENEIFESIDQCISIVGSSCAVPGDINGDDILNVSDIVIMVSNILGNSTITNEQLSCSDINEDGIINVSDIVLVIAIILAG